MKSVSIYLKIALVNFVNLRCLFNLLVGEEICMDELRIENFASLFRAGDSLDLRNY